MRRRLFNLAAAVSLVLCLAALTLWGQSYWRGEAAILRCGRERALGVISERGRIALVSRSHDSTSTTKYFSVPLAGHAPAIMRSFGMETTAHSTRLFVPDWAVVTLLSCLPLLRVVYRRRAKPIACCPMCGYDLRGTPDRCPECGAVPAEEAGGKVAAARMG